MRRILRHRIAIAGAAVVLAAGGGAAYAASRSSSNPREGFINDVAKRLDVSPQRLTSAIKAAVIDKLDAAVKDGRLTRAEADAIEHQIEMKGPPVGFGPGADGVGHPPGLFGAVPPLGPAGALAAAAKYLGLDDTQLLNELRSGRSLAQVATARGKSVSGLEQAITGAIESRLDRALAAKLITKSQEQQLLGRLSSTLGDLVNRTPPRFSPGRGGPAGPRIHPSPIPPF